MKKTIRKGTATLAAIAAMGGSGLTAFTAQTASAAEVGGQRYAGYRWNGSTSWIGDYQFNSGTIAYCADPNRDGPSSGGTYSGPTTINSAGFARDDGSGVTNSTALAEIAYLLDRYGNTASPSQAAAIDAAIYHLEGYSAYNLNNTSSWGSRRANTVGVRAQALSYVSEAVANRGAYTATLTTNVPSTGAVGGQTYNATVRMTSTGGSVAGLDNMPVTFTFTNAATGAKTTVNATMQNGVATIPFHIPTGSKYTVTATVTKVPSTTVQMLTPQYSNAQRMFIAGITDTKAASTTVSSPTPPPTKVTPKITTTSSIGGRKILTGGYITDSIKVTGGQPNSTLTVVSRLYGPLASAPAVSKDAPAGAALVKSENISIKLDASGNGTGVTTRYTIPNGAVGYYSYDTDWNAQGNMNAGDAQFGVASETGQAVENTPIVTTHASSILIDSNGAPTPVFDIVDISNYPAGASFSGTSTLYGPFDTLTGAKPDATKKIATATFRGIAGTDGTATVEARNDANGNAISITQPGYYIWQETLNDANGTTPVTGDFGDIQETTLVTNPNISSQIGITRDGKAASGDTLPGDTISDTVNYTGLGIKSTDDFTTITLTGTLYAKSAADTKWQAVKSFSSNFDNGEVVDTSIPNLGTYQIPEETPSGTKFAYGNEQLTVWFDRDNDGVKDNGEVKVVDIHNPGQTAADAKATDFIEKTQMTEVKYTPKITTVSSAAIAKPGAKIHDNVTVTGTHGLSGTAIATLKGYVPPVNGSCENIPATTWATAKDIATVEFAVDGDGTYATPDITLPDGQIGCVTFFEKGVIAGAPVETPPGEPEESTLVINPTVTTKVSDNASNPGDTITDTAIVTGLPDGITGTLDGTLNVKGADGKWKPVDGVSINESDVPSGEKNGLGAYTIPQGTPEGTVYSYEEGLTVWYDRNGNEKRDNGEVVVVNHNTNFTEAAQASTVGAPEIVTQTSKYIAKAGDQIADTIHVTGTNGKTGTLTATLKGYVAPVNGSCENIPAATWATAKDIGSVKVEVNGDGDYKTNNVTLPAGTIGCVTWVEKGIIGNTPVETPPGAPNESTLVVNPNVTTKVSSQTSTPGQTISDTAIVTGVPAGIPATIGGGLNSQVAGGEWAPVDGVTISKAVTGSGTFAALGAYTVPANAVDGTKFSYNEKVSVWYDQNKDGKVDEGETIESAPHNADNTVAAQTSTVVVPPQPTPPQPTPEQPFIPVTPEQPVTQVDAGGDQSQGSADSGGIDGGVIGDPTDIGGALAGGGLLAAGVALIAGLKRRRK